MQKVTISEDIKIAGVNELYDRFKVADDIQDACNPSGVARELVRVIASAMRDPACTGTDFVRNDPAVRCVVDKLASLTGVQSFDHDAHFQLSKVLDARRKT
jgi:hypothetical protein